MATTQDDIPEGLLCVMKENAESADVSAPLTDEVLDAAVKAKKVIEKVELVSADDRIVSFVDLLGTKSLMQQVGNQAQAQETYNTLSSIGELFKKCVKDWLQDVPDKECHIISDSYVVSVPDDPEAFVALIRSIADFQRRCLLDFNELSRGGVAKGKMVVGTKMMIGKAFVEAHLLEKHIASYPRVVINSDINMTEVRREVPISHDKDGMNYVSFLSGLDIKDLQTAYSIVQRKKQEKSDSTELHKRQKWEWIRQIND